eukprot:3514353-Prymnesium_polylepis.1
MFASVYLVAPSSFQWVDCVAMPHGQASVDTTVGALGWLIACSCRSSCRCGQWSRLHNAGSVLGCRLQRKPDCHA